MSANIHVFSNSEKIHFASTFCGVEHIRNSSPSWKYVHSKVKNIQVEEEVFNYLKRKMKLVDRCGSRCCMTHYMRGKQLFLVWLWMRQDFYRTFFIGKYSEIDASLIFDFLDCMAINFKWNFHWHQAKQALASLIYDTELWLPAFLLWVHSRSCSPGKTFSGIFWIKLF